MDVSEDTVATSGSSCEPAISTTVVSSLAELEAVQDEWDRFIEDSGSDIYFTVDWLQIWWSHYGGQRDLRCYLLRRGGRVIAALPFCIGPLRAGPVSVRLARFAGAESTLVVLHPAIENGLERQVLDLVCGRLLDEESCDAVSLSPLSGLSPVGAAVQELCVAGAPYHLARDDSPGPHTIFALPGDFQEYLRNLPKQARSNFRRDSRQLLNHYSLRHEVVTGGDVAACYDTFVALHEAQWRATGRLGHFGDWPGSQSFNRELVTRLSRKRNVRFHQLWGNGEVISVQFGFVLGDRYFWRLPARRTDATNERLGLGRLGLVMMLEALLEEAIRLVEAGPGHYDYKLRYGGEEYPMRRQVLTRTTLSARAKVSLLIRWSDAIDLLYYRIWFITLSRRFGNKQPLRRFWIRSRL